MSHTANEQVYGVTVTKGDDPTGTHAIQVEFVKDLQRRFRRIRGLIRTVIAENDALALRDDTTVPSLTPQASLSANEDTPDVFDFPTEEGRIRAFIKLVRDWLSEGMLEDVTPQQARNGEHWTADYIQNAYVRGTKTAVGRLNQQGVSAVVEQREELLERPVPVRQLRRLYSRTFENLKDITDDAAQTIREELTEAVAQGENPRKVASRINRQVKSLTDTRATTLARTEIINSNANGTLDTYERADVDVVTHVSRMTAKDARVCAFCRALGDVPFSLSEFRDVAVRWGSSIYRVGVPAHPNGRCSPAPEIGLEAGELEPIDERIPDRIAGKSVTILNR